MYATPRLIPRERSEAAAHWASVKEGVERKEVELVDEAGEAEEGREEVEVAGLGVIVRLG